VVVTWTPPTGEISGYIIVYGPKDAPPPETLSAVNVDNPAVTAYTLEDITPEREYTIEMWAYLELPSSRSQPTTIHLDVPDQPTNVVATLTMSDTVMVQWEGPPSSADVDGYIISYSPTESYCEGLPEGEVVVNGPETTQLEVAEMAAGVEYDVRVAAYNSIGTGPFSVPPARITIPQKAPEGEPLNVSVVPVPPDALSVLWEPPNCLRRRKR
jgi:hypothetical protein